MRLIYSFVLVFCLHFLLSSCSRPGEKEVPQLGEIYQQAAASHQSEQLNPVIVIPGILGSKIKDPESGKSIWGVFDNEFLNLNRPENFQIAAVPIQKGSAISQASPRGVPDGAVSSLRFRVAGVPLKQQAYAGILKSLGVGGFKDSDVKPSNLKWGKEHFTCFQFSYDWRLSNAQNARALHEFIQDKKRYIRQKSKELYGKDRPNLKFDIVAHSMGGLVARYYLRYGTQALPSNGSLPKLNWQGTRDVNQLIMVGTPNSGSIVAFSDILTGKSFLPEWQRRVLGIGLPRLPAAVIGTYPSLYELFPRSRHQPVLDASNKSALDIFDHKLWEKQNWGILQPEEDHVLKTLLPHATDRAQRRELASDHLKKCLNNASQFHRALDRPATPPKGFRITLISGDAISTKRQVAIDLSNNKQADYSYAPGDGTVLRSSTLADDRLGSSAKWTPRLRSPIKFHRVTFFTKEHLLLTQDPSFTDNLLYQLLEEPR